MGSTERVCVEWRLRHGSRDSCLRTHSVLGNHGEYTLTNAHTWLEARVFTIAVHVYTLGKHNNTQTAQNLGVGLAITKGMGHLLPKGHYEPKHIHTYTPSYLQSM